MLQVNTIYNKNCVDGMRELDENSIDLVITSPPYDNRRTYKGYSFDFEGVAKGLYRVIKDGGVVVWVTNDATIDGSETCTSFKQALYFKEIGFNLYDTMIMLKNAASYPMSTRYYPVFDYMFVFSKGKPKTIHLIADKVNKYGGVPVTGTERKVDGSLVKKNGAKINKKVKLMGIRNNVWRYNVGTSMTKDKIAYQHPAIFPEKMVRDHIISWSNKGDLVMDPFSGSGTTAKIAFSLGRDYIGFDISAEYCDIARKRIGNTQLDMFEVSQ